MNFQANRNRNGSVYAATARFDNARALTEDELRTLAPSVFATEAHVSRSTMFKPIPTIQVVRDLAEEGFAVVGATQSRTRLDDRRDFTKHLLRIRKLDETVTYKSGDTVPEMLLKNANDGTAAYDLMAGLWRILCMNSLVALTSTTASCKVRHSGNVAHKVIEGTFQVIEQSRLALAAPEAWSTVMLNRDEKQIFAEAAHEVRFGTVVEGEAQAVTAIQPVQLLQPRRWDDRASDLWTVFNVVQENAMKGGLEARAIDKNGNYRKSSSRAIKGVDQSTGLNRALFTLANKMAELHGVKIAA